MRRFAGLLLTVLLSALSGCGEQASGQTKEKVVTLTVRNSRFAPSSVEVAPGTIVRFVVRNLDPIGHELIVGDKATHDRHESGTEAHHGDRPGEVSVALLATAETTYRFDAPGKVLFGCHLPGHWDYGMQGAVTVG
ncbi:MAG: cupredoxin domain-containing protein [Acidimicrobiales bacterium]